VVVVVSGRVEASSGRTLLPMHVRAAWMDEHPTDVR
jgi:hypothetical protein